MGAFPGGNSALMLLAARLRHIAGTMWGTERYMDMKRLREAQESERRSIFPETSSRWPQHRHQFGGNIRSINLKNPQQLRSSLVPKLKVRKNLDTPLNASQTTVIEVPFAL